MLANEKIQKSLTPDEITVPRGLSLIFHTLFNAIIVIVQYPFSNLHSKDAGIPNLLNKSKSLKHQARQAFDLRNEFRTKARDMMVDQVEAQRLRTEEPNMTWKQVKRKYRDKGYKGDKLFEKIIESSQKSRQSVNES